MRVFLLCLSFIFLIFQGCTKNTDEPNNSNNNNKPKLSDFSVTVLERTSISAIIRWDSSKNLLNGEPVKYKIILEKNIIKTGIDTLIDTLVNLDKNQAYQGKVVAYLPSGDSVVSDFSLSTYDGSVYAFTEGVNRSYLGGYNAYPIPGIYTQPSKFRLNYSSVTVPTLSNDTLFTIADSRLTAFNATNGSIIWSTAVSTYNSPVTYNRGRLYVCVNGGLSCIDSKTGNVNWTYLSSNYYVTLNSTPVIDNNKVFVAVTNSNNAEMHALDLITGQKYWTIRFNSSICKRPLAKDGVVVFSSGTEGAAYGYSQNDGSLLWTKSGLIKIGANDFNPVYVNGNVLVHTIFDLYALDIKTGREVWMFDNGTLLSECIRGDGKLFFCKDIPGSHKSRSIICMDEKTRKILWRHDATGQSGMQFSHLVFAKDKIYCLLLFAYAPVSARIVVLNASTGQFDQTVNNHDIITKALYDGVTNFCVARDGVTCYPQYHGNYN